MLSGMQAAEAVAGALAAGRSHDELASYEDGWRGSAIGRDLKPVRNAKPLWSRLGTPLGIGAAGFDLWTNTLGFSLSARLAHGKPDHATLLPAAGTPPIAYPRPDGVTTFDRPSSLFESGVAHAEDQPVHLRVRDAELQKRSEHDVFGGPSARYCPAGVYEWVEGRGRVALTGSTPPIACTARPAHQGPQPEHRLGATRGRRRAQLPGDVAFGTDVCSRRRCSGICHPVRSRLLFPWSSISAAN